MNSTSHPNTPGPSDQLSESVAQAILQAVAGIRYGQVTVIIQDGRVMQIDRTERQRLTAEKSSS